MSNNRRLRRGLKRGRAASGLSSALMVVGMTGGPAVAAPPTETTSSAQGVLIGTAGPLGQHGGWPSSRSAVRLDGGGPDRFVGQLPERATGLRSAGLAGSVGWARRWQGSLPTWPQEGPPGATGCPRPPGRIGCPRHAGCDRRAGLQGATGARGRPAPRVSRVLRACKARRVTPVRRVRPVLRELRVRPVPRGHRARRARRALRDSRALRATQALRVRPVPRGPKARRVT